MRSLLVFVSCNLLTLVHGHAQRIVAGLQNVQANVNYLHQMVFNFQGDPLVGIFDALKIQAQSDHVGHAVEWVTWAADESHPLDEQGSLAVAAAILALRPDVEALLKTITYKKPAFDRIFVGLASISKQVQTSLTDQKALAAAMGYSIAQKLFGVFKEQAPPLLDEISAAFDRTIASYVNTDSIQIPSLPIPPFTP